MKRIIFYQFPTFCLFNVLSLRCFGIRRFDSYSFTPYDSWTISLLFIRVLLSTQTAVKTCQLQLTSICSWQLIDKWCQKARFPWKSVINRSWQSLKVTRKSAWFKQQYFIVSKTNNLLNPDNTPNKMPRLFQWACWQPNKSAAIFKSQLLCPHSEERRHNGDSCAVVPHYTRRFPLLWNAGAQRPMSLVSLRPTTQQATSCESDPGILPPSRFGLLCRTNFLKEKRCWTAQSGRQHRATY